MSIAQRIRDARIPRQYLGMTKKAWSETRADGRPSPWPVEVSQWVAGARGPFVTLTGGTGAGKTHVAVATLQHYLCGQGVWGRPRWWMTSETERLGGMFVHARELADEYRASRYNRPLLAAALKHPLVVVDDAAWDRNTEDIQRGALAALILNAEQTGMGLMITTNLPVSVFVDKAFDRKFTSRLETGFIVELEGEDRR